MTPKKPPEGAGRPPAEPFSTALGGSWVARASFAAAFVAILATASCALDRPPALDERLLLEQFYESQLNLMRAVDGAFYRLGEELRILQIEYERAERPDLAELAGRRADVYHRDHLMYQARITEIAAKLMRIRRGESPVAVHQETPAPSPSPTSAPRATPLAPPPPLPSVTPTPAGGSIPMPTPTPIATGPPPIPTPTPRATPTPGPEPADSSIPPVQWPPPNSIPPRAG
jgi:hypothetical protein